MGIKYSDFIKIESFLSANNIHKDDICLVSSLSLAQIGIRENNDIDLVIKLDVRRKKFNQDNVIIISNHIDIVQSPWSSIYSDDEIIDKPNLHTIVDGYKVVIPELVYHKKIWLNRPKDQRDILELNEYAKVSSSWDWRIINDYFPKNKFLRRVKNSLKNRLGIVRDRIRERISYFTKIHSDAIEVIPTNLLLSKQTRSTYFNRYDLMIRYMAIESFMLDDNFEFELYNRMQKKRDTSEYKNPEKVFKNLISSFKMIGFDLYSPIIVDEEMHVINGAHRLSCALYFGVKLVPIRIFRGSFKTYFGIDWFKKNEFSDADINLLEKKKENIFLENYMYFEVVLWPPVASFFNEIEELIREKFTIISSKDHDDILHFNAYIKALYKIDDIKDWKVNLKIQRMSAYPKDIRIIKIEIPEPNFRYKDNNQLISKVVEKLKAEIRTKYKSKVDNYFHDIIIHIGDNYSHSKQSSLLEINV
jgi:hypothetical protein